MQSVSANDALLRLDAVGVRFGVQEVLRNVALEFQRGQTTVVIGESGCGKTCLLKLLIGLLRPTTGRVLLDGKDLATLPANELAKQRLRFGYLFQGAALFDSLSVFENIAFPLREHARKSEEEIGRDVRQRLEEVGLTADVEAKSPAELSGGMRKRVGLARAIILDPEIILYDEPTTGLDPVMSGVIDELIAQMRERRSVTSIIVTHDLGTVHRVAERIIMLLPTTRLGPEEGQAIFDGDQKLFWSSSDSRVLSFMTNQPRTRE